MFRKEWTPVVWGLVLVGGLAQGVSSKSMLASLSVWAVAPPHAVFDFDEGLDARDAKNRPVSSADAKEELRRLFVNQLYTLVLNPVLTQRTSLADLIQQVWQSVTAQIAPFFPTQWFKNFDVSAPSIKKGFFYAVRATPFRDRLKSGRENMGGSPGFQIPLHLLFQSSTLLRL